MNFGIITHYDVHNHGAVMQLTALVRLLAQKGISASALRFDKNYDLMGTQMKSKYELSLKSIPHYFRFLKERGIGSFLFNFKKRKILEEFKSDNNLIGPFYSEAGQLDGVIIGSDEVFALHTGITPVFFGHALPTNHVVSYAGSFGPTTIDDVDRLHCRNIIKSGLVNMDLITVRDLNSAGVVADITGSRPEIVIDPVLLYGFIEELKIVRNPGLSDKYLLIYAYDKRMNDPQEIEAIKTYARKKQLKIVSAGFYHSWCDLNIPADPIELLSLFKFATAVITDTFHGSVFSIITGANVAVITRNENRFKLTSLLSEYSLSDRIFDDWDDLERVLENSIDYQSVNFLLEQRRDESMKALDKMIEICS